LIVTKVQVEIQVLESQATHEFSFISDSYLLEH